MATDKVGAIFFANVVRAVADMREAGMNETQISCILQDIRAAAISEERLRAECVYKDNPPKYPTHIEMRDAVCELIEPQ